MSSHPLHGGVRYWRAPDLPGVEVRAASYRHAAFRMHTHRDFSLGLVLGGSTRFLLRGRPRTARSGQIVVIPPEAAHACNPDAAGLTYRMFALDPGLLRAAAGGVFPAFPPAFADGPLFSAWNRLFAAIVGDAPGTEKQALLAACLGALTARHARPGEPRRANPAVEHAQALVAANRGTFLPLDALSHAAGLSRRQFLRVFKAETGLTPHGYQMQQAVERAKKLLLAGEPFSQAALDAGFADQSHFTRCFRRLTGATPGQYAGIRR